MKFTYKILRKVLFAMSVTILFANMGLAKEGHLTGTVVKVTDGDTVVIDIPSQGRSINCRLYGIDAPETSKRGKPGQFYGEESSRTLSAMIFGKTVNVVLTGDKTYGRDVCVIYLGELNVNVNQVRGGYAWAYQQYLKRPHASVYLEAEAAARRERLGLWQQSNPQPPWEFRKKGR